MSLTQSANVQHFDAVANQYDAQFGLSVEIARARVRHIVDHSKSSVNPGSALDLGCGTGNLTAALLAEGAATSSVGFDISAGMVDVGRKKTAHMDNISF